MVKHVVFFKMKETALNASKEKNIKALDKKFHSLENLPGVLKMETGLSIDNEQYDFCLNMDFEDEKALEAYLVHPDHLLVKAFVFNVIDHRVLVDYAV